MAASKSSKKSSTKASMQHGEHKSASGLVIAGFLLFGLGLGFWIDEVPAGLFVGLGVGLLLAAIIRMREKC